MLVRHIAAGPFEPMAKEDLPALLCPFASGVLRVEAQHDPGHFDLVHSHYWLSGQVGTLAQDRWQVPLVHSMHTMAKVKNSLMADGDVPEPSGRVIGESSVVAAADRLLANTSAEASQLIDLYGAHPAQVATVPPGVDLSVFTPGDGQAARRRLGLAPSAHVLLFVGRIQPLKAPDLLLRAAAQLLDEQPALRDELVVAVVGGPSGSGLAHPHHLEALARELGIADVVRFAPPVAQSDLVDWYRAADVTVVPSYNESFGLVAIESQAVRDAGGRGVRRGPADCGLRRCLWRLDRGARTAQLCGRARAVDRRTPATLGVVGRCRAARGRVRLGCHRQGHPRRLPGCAGIASAAARGVLTRKNAAVDAAATVREALSEFGVPFEEPASGTFVAVLPGERKLRTTVSLVVGPHSLTANAFVVRHPDENTDGVHRWLLQHNAKHPGIAFGIDPLGDVYVVGQLPLGAVTVAEVDQLLGRILDVADASFNTLLELGFASQHQARMGVARLAR